MIKLCQFNTFTTGNGIDFIHISKWPELEKYFGKCVSEEA